MVLCKHPMTHHTLKCNSRWSLKTKIILLFHLQQKHRSMVWKINFKIIFRLILRVLDNLHFQKIFHFSVILLSSSTEIFMKPLLTGKKSYHHFGLDWKKGSLCSEKSNRMGRKSVTWFKKYTGWLQHQSYSDPIVILISLPRMSVWWNHLLVSRTTAK